MTAARKWAVRAAGALVTFSGAGTLARWQRHRRGDFRVFILEYHDVCEGTFESEGVVSAARFRCHIRYLSQRFKLASLSEALTHLAKPGQLREDLLVLTFDDGHLGNYESAWPVLQQERVPAVIFITTGFLDGSELWFDLARRSLDAARRAVERSGPRVPDDLRLILDQFPASGDTGAVIERLKRFAPDSRNQLLEQLRAACGPLAAPARALRWDQVREMTAGGVEIGCHTVSHPVLTTLPPAQQQQEIREARDRIQEETGIAPVLFAYHICALEVFVWKYF
jgi:peptidoglycan/xylan/chitin deacetylase (PgdA/CDA1 family)